MPNSSVKPPAMRFALLSTLLAACAVAEYPYARCWVGEREIRAYEDNVGSYKKTFCNGTTFCYEAYGSYNFRDVIRGCGNDKFALLVHKTCKENGSKDYKIHRDKFNFKCCDGDYCNLSPGGFKLLSVGAVFSTCFCICSCACVVNLGQISGFFSRRSDRPTSGTALSRMHESFRSHSSLQEHQ